MVVTLQIDVTQTGDLFVINGISSEYHRAFKLFHMYVLSYLKQDFCLLPPGQAMKGSHSR